MTFVVDASVALAWLFEDEVQDATEALFDRTGETGATAPSVWPLEVLNALTVAERRKRIDAEQRQRYVATLRNLPIEIDAETLAKAWTATLHLAVQQRLSIYDASYLELAQRLKLPLATLDRNLRGAAEASGVVVLGQD